jgi:hypothetical protein
VTAVDPNRIRAAEDALQTAQDAQQAAGWGQPDLRTAVLEAERELADARGEPWADVIDLGVRWSAGAPLPHLVSDGGRAFIVCLAEMPDPSWDGSTTRMVSPADPAPDGIVVIELSGCDSLMIGGPNDETLAGHPLYGRGLDFYQAHEVCRSAWLEDRIAQNSVHPHHREDGFRQLRHLVFAFHDEMVESLCREARAETIYGTLGAVLDACGRAIVDGRPYPTSD